MEQLSLGMARGMRQPGEGAVSDFEGKLFAKMAGGYNRPYGTNVAFAQAGKSLAQRQIDMQQFREAYLQANGTLVGRSEEHTSELQSLMRISYAVFCLKKKKQKKKSTHNNE